MIDQKLIESPEESPEKPELEIMLSGCVPDAERKAVRDAFHTFAQGDPGGFSVQFAVLLQAHARALKSSPERLRKVVALEFTQMSDVMVSHRSVVKDSAAGIAKDAADIRDQVDLLAKANQELRQLINQMPEAEP